MTQPQPRTSTPPANAEPVPEPWTADTARAQLERLNAELVERGLPPHPAATDPTLNDLHHANTDTGNALAQADHDRRVAQRERQVDAAATRMDRERAGDILQRKQEIKDHQRGCNMPVERCEVCADVEFENEELYESRLVDRRAAQQAATLHGWDISELISGSRQRNQREAAERDDVDGDRHRQLAGDVEHRQHEDEAEDEPEF